MPSGFSTDFMEELIYKCDIVEIISQYVPLAKKGGRYFGSCPFHNEKTPSFCVNQASGFYHCFGCGASGNVIKFIMEIESLPFYDAVKLLADKAGMVLPEYKADPEYGKKKEKRDVLKQLMRDAAVYYRNNLLKEKEGAAAREYLRDRGVSDETAKRYGLGLSLNYDSLQGYLRRKGYSKDNLRDCGLVNGDMLADAFANRIIVPIMNAMSEVVAFGGRIYQGEENVAKYKNSTNTLLFDKGRVVYGINFVKKERKAGGGFKELILVEGYMDVIALGAAGVRNAVAGMGTALTQGQAQEIKRIAPSVYVCYDGDEAGRKATIKNIEVLSNCGLDVKVVSLPDGSDPDDTVRAEGYDGFMKRVAEALPIIDYKLKLCADAYDLNSVNGRAKYVGAAVKVLKSLQSAAEREVYLQTVSQLSGVSVDTLAKEFSVSSPVLIKTKSTAEKEARNLIASRFIINRLLNGCDYADTDALRREWLPHPVHQAVYDFARTRGKGGINVGVMYDFLSDEPELNKILDVRLNFDNRTREGEYYFDCLNTIANEYLSVRLEYLKERFKALSDAEERRAAIVEITELTKKLKSVNIKDKL